MPPLKTDIEKLKALHSKGLNINQMAMELGVHKSNVSRQLKRLGLTIARVTVQETMANVAHDKVSTKHYKQESLATKYLLFLAHKAKSELDWIEDTIPPKNTKAYREWQEQKLKFAAEMRKLINAMADIGYKLFHTEEIKEILEIILDEVGNESPECQKRIHERIERRRAIRFPSLLNG